MTAYVDESLRLDGTGLYVLRKERPASKTAMSAVLAGLGLSTVATRLRSTPPARSGARRHCLIRLLWELDQRRVSSVVFETRRGSDPLDAAVVAHAIRAGWVATDFRADYARPDVEPLLWLPDVVAGAVRADADGDGRWLALLGDVVEVVRAP